MKKDKQISKENKVIKSEVKDEEKLKKRDYGFKRTVSENQGIKIESFEDTFKFISKDLSLILSDIKNKNPKFIEKIQFNRVFKEKEDFNIFIKGLVLDFLKDKSDDLKSRLSDLRKKGYPVLFLSLRFMSVPLKIKLFSSSLNKEDFNKIFILVENIEKSLISFEEQERAVKENERIELQSNK